MTPQPTRLICHGIPANARPPRSRCGAFLDTRLGVYTFVATAKKHPELNDGIEWRWCSRCRVWNGFRRVGEAAA